MGYTPGAKDLGTRAALTDLGAPDGHIEVQIVDRIERSGAAAKQNLVARPQTTY